MHDAPASDCPGCMAHRQLLIWILHALRRAALKRDIMARIRLAIDRGAEMTARAPVVVWFPIHLQGPSPCRSSTWFDGPDAPRVQLAECECYPPRDVGWRMFRELIDVAADA